MATTKNDQEQMLDHLFSGNDLKVISGIIMRDHRAFQLRMKDQDNYLLSTEEVETILHRYYPDLSATVSGPVIILFHEVRPQN